MKSGILKMSVCNAVAMALCAVGVIFGIAGCGDSEMEIAARRTAEIERLARERERAAEEERARQEMERRRQAREREEAERVAAERERRKKLAEEEAERRRKNAEREAAVRNYRAAREKFGVPFQFAKTAPKDENPMTVESRKKFWCVFASYGSDRCIHEIDATPGGKMGVSVLSPDGLVSSVSPDAVFERLKSEKYAITSGGKVYVGGVRMPGGLYDVPADGGFSIMEASFGELQQTAVALGLQVPNVKYKVYLKPKNSKSSKNNILLGVIGYDGVVERRAMESAVGDVVSKSAVKAAVASGTVVKKKKFKQTVVLYDGTILKKEMGGVTKVPRNYQHHGTSNYGLKNTKAVEADWRKWKALYDEAVRQEQKARDIEAENELAIARARSEREQRLNDASRAGNDSAAIEKELAKYKLLVVFEK